ncbi:MAG: hypothetical protein Q8R82_21375, partial [Hyphomonadaceae bacterium]|nr:hypothetical protein [Hyphomonadaceae bacterium]
MPLTAEEIAVWRRGLKPQPSLKRVAADRLIWVIKGQSLDRDDNLCHPDAAVWELERRIREESGSRAAEAAA